MYRLGRESYFGNYLFQRARLLTCSYRNVCEVVRISFRRYLRLNSTVSGLDRRLVGYEIGIQGLNLVSIVGYSAAAGVS